MPNALDGTTASIIAQEGFSAFLQTLTPLRVFATDFSNEVEKAGDTVTTHVVPAYGAAGDLQTDHGGSRKTAAADTATLPVPVTLSSQPIQGFHISDEEAGQISSGVLSDLIRRRIEGAAHSVAKKILEDLFNGIVAASFPNATNVGAAADFDLQDVIDLNATLADAGFPVDTQRAVALVLGSSYRAALKKDGAIQDVSASGTPEPVVATGQLHQVDTFGLYQSSTLPPAGGAAAGENLIGFAARPDAFALAMRPVLSQAPRDLVVHELLQDPETGATMIYRAFYDPDFGEMYHTFESLFGFAKANGDALHRLTSA